MIPTANYLPEAFSHHVSTHSALNTITADPGEVLAVANLDLKVHVDDKSDADRHLNPPHGYKPDHQS